MLTFNNKNLQQIDEKKTFIFDQLFLKTMSIYKILLWRHFIKKITASKITNRN